MRRRSATDRCSRYRPAQRSGYVLIAVLIVIVVLSLAAYKFTDLMTAKQRESQRANDAAQVRLWAISGLHYAAGALADPNTLSGLGNPFANGTFPPQMVQPGQSPRTQGWFSLVAVAEPSQGVYQQNYGSVTDEAGKLNINALILLDPTGNVLYNALMMLPNMTANIADSIVDWVDTDDTPRANGNETSYYESLNNPYQAKNGPLNSIDELLLVAGVTPQLLYGNDRNRDGVANDDPSGNSQFDRGWYDYLTVYGRELNFSSTTGAVRTNINDTEDLNTLYSTLLGSVGSPLADYILAYKMFTVAPVPTTTTSSTSSGSTTASSGSTTSASSGSGTGSTNQGTNADLTTAVTAALAGTSPTAVQSFVTVLDMLNTQVTLPVPAGAMPGTQPLVVPCPLNDPSQLPTLLPVLLDTTTATSAIELPPRLNINTAPYEVLMLLTNTVPVSAAAALAASTGSPSTSTTSTATTSATTSTTSTTSTSSAAATASAAATSATAAVSVGTSGILASTDVDNIMAQQSAQNPTDLATTTGAWLLISGVVTPTQFVALLPFVSGQTMVYRVQSIGYFGQGGPVGRVEAVVDTNQGNPRFLYFRDLSGIDNPRGFVPPTQQQ